MELKAILQIINAFYLLRVGLLSTEPNLRQSLKLLSNIKHFFFSSCAKTIVPTIIYI